MIRVKIKGRNPEYFLVKLINKNIRYSNLSIGSKEIIFDVELSDYNIIKDIKTSYEIEVVSNLGIYKYFVYFIRYWYIFMFFILSIFYIVFLSNVIFEVEVVHSNSSIKELVYSNLKEFGISKYKFKVNFLEKERIVSEILKREVDDLEWMEIEEVGSKYIVKVEQRKKNKNEDVCLDRHIIAKKDAMISSIFAIEGEVLKKKHDYVKKGDILISGFIYNKEKIVSKRCAVGEVIGEVWYKVLVELPSKYYEEKVTGDKSHSLEVQFFDKNLVLFNKFNNYQVKRFSLLKSNLLPIGLYYSTFLETDIINIDYDINNIDDVAVEMAEKKIYDRVGKDIEIKQKKVLKKIENNSKIEVEVFIKVLENITDYFDITGTDIEEINNSNKEE